MVGEFAVLEHFHSDERVVVIVGRCAFFDQLLDLVARSALKLLVLEFGASTRPNEALRLELQVMRVTQRLATTVARTQRGATTRNRR